MSALSGADLDALRAAAGDDAVHANAPLEVDGAKLEATVEPPDAAALARTVAALAERGIGCVISGSGSQLAFGNPPRGARVALSTRRLDRVIELDAEEGVAHVEAGTPIGLAAARTVASGWDVPTDARAASTLGGVLATGAVGPRHLAWGRPRDFVLGLEVVLGDGTPTRCGGRVVKNVTGYDLMKLHVGGSGALGVITSAWLRLRPLPEACRVLVAQLADGPASMARAIAAARAVTARACVLVDARIALAVEPSRAPKTGWLLLVECAGDEAAVARDALQLATELGAEETDRLALARGGAIARSTFGEVGLLFRLAVLPARLAEVADELHRCGAALVAHPGSGLVQARVALDAEVDGATYAAIFAQAHPDRFFEMFISEQQMIAAAVGLAVCRYVPFASTFAAFLTRGYDFVRMAAVSRAKICLCGSHAGVSIGEDGPSQMGLEDLAMMRAVLGSTVLYPCCANQTVKLVAAMLEPHGVTYLRTTREATPVLYAETEAFPIGGSKVLRASRDDRIAIIAAGVTVHEALEAHDRLADEGVAARVVDAYSIKPLDEGGVRAAVSAARGCAVVVEDHFAEGGLGSAVFACLGGEDPLPARVAHLAVRSMPGSGSPDELLHAAGIDADAIVDAARRVLAAAAAAEHVCFLCGARASWTILLAGEDEQVTEEYACDEHASGHRRVEREALPSPLHHFHH